MGGSACEDEAIGAGIDLFYPGIEGFAGMGKEVEGGEAIAGRVISVQGAGCAGDPYCSLSRETEGGGFKIPVDGVIVEMACGQVVSEEGETGDVPEVGLSIHEDVSDAAVGGYG